MENSESWFFGTLSRDDATKLLVDHAQMGAFLVRESTSVKGDLVLTVKEPPDDEQDKCKISHFIINRVVTRNTQTQAQQVCFRIGDKLFRDLTALLNFYHLHKLDKIRLIEPVKCIDESFKNNRTFKQYLQDLPRSMPFVSISPTPVQSTLLASSLTDTHTQTLSQSSTSSSSSASSLHNSHSLNSSPRKSHIDIAASEDIATLRRFKPSSPIRFLSHKSQIIDSNPLSTDQQVARSLFPQQAQVVGQNNSEKYPQCIVNNKTLFKQRKLPALAKAVQTRIPNAYDKTALTFKEGDVIKVTKIDISGKWEGELNSRKGHFPFTHVELIESNYDPVMA